MQILIKLINQYSDKLMIKKKMIKNLYIYKFIHI
jgi:hypothetical protein